MWPSGLVSFSNIWQQAISRPGHIDWKQNFRNWTKRSILPFHCHNKMHWDHWLLWLKIKLPEHRCVLTADLVDCPTQLVCTWIFICSMTKLKEHSREICYSRLQFAWSKHWLLTSWLLTCVHDIEGFPCHSSTLCVEGGARAEEVLRTGNSRNPGLSATSFIHPSPSNEAWVLPDGWLRMSLFAVCQVQTEAQSGPVCTLHCHSYLGLCDDKDY